MNEALERANGTQRARAGVRAVAPSRSTPPTGTYVLAIEIGSRLGVVGCAAFLGASGVHAQQSAPSSLVALEIDGGVRNDGVLDEEAWERAQKVSNFTQRELDVGEPATERTQVAVLFDDDALYVGFWGFDSDANGIRATQMARDFSWTSDDNFEVILDPFDDNRTGYLFVTNANGARADALIAANGSSTNRDWDGVWDVRSRRTDEGWFAELRIPFSTLRFPTEVGRGWGINFERNIRRKREQLLWQGWSRDYNLETLSQAGSLEGLAGLGGTKLLEARPFGVGGSEWRSGQPRDRVADVGLDLSWLATPSWRINFTVRPDFAQVESDREEVNLTRFPLFFPEKRNFFLEGNEFFDFNLGGDVQPFYSRRIGLAEDRTEVPIDGGARVLGRQGKTSIGAMALRTAGTPSEDAANFGVVRWRQDVLDESSIGVLAVARGGAGSSNITYGADGRYASSELFGDKEFAAGGAVAQTYASDAADRVGVAHRLFVSYPNDLIEFSASWRVPILPSTRRSASCAAPTTSASLRSWRFCRGHDSCRACSSSRSSPSRSHGTRAREPESCSRYTPSSCRSPSRCEPGTSSSSTSNGVRTGPARTSSSSRGRPTYPPGSIGSHAGPSTYRRTGPVRSRAPSR
jgi:hypothetical protein